MALSAINKETPIFKPAFEYQESTLQLPFGEYSIFSDLQANRVSPIEAMVTLVLCYRSTWSTGLTWSTSSRALAKCLHISHRYVRDVLSKATAGSTANASRKAIVRGRSRSHITCAIRNSCRWTKTIDRCLSLCRGAPVACLNVSSLAISTGKPHSSG